MYIVCILKFTFVSWSRNHIIHDCDLTIDTCKFQRRNKNKLIKSVLTSNFDPKSGKMHY